MLKYTIVLIITSLLVGCGPTVVSDYSPGYDPNSIGYHQNLPPIVIYNGVNGYWVSGAFMPAVMIGGVYGYRGAGGQFNTSTSNRTTIINNYNTERTQYQSQRNSAPSANRPNYGTQSGAATRSAGTVSQPTVNKPAYGNQTGTATRGYSSGVTTQSRPIYGSQTGSAVRSSTPAASRPYSAPSAPSRPSYSNASPSSSSSRPSSRR